MADIVARIAGVQVSRSPFAGPSQRVAGFQPLPVRARIKWRYILNWRADARRLAGLLPRPLVVDERYGCGFVSTCVLQIQDMGIVGMPRWLRFSTFEMLYRVAVRVGDANGPRSFLTLGSDVSSRAMAALGARFSHYLPRHAEFRAEISAERIGLACRDRNGLQSAFRARTERTTSVPRTSEFPSLEAATDFILGVDGAVSIGAGGGVRWQPIDHPPWDVGFAEPEQRDFAFLEALDDERRLGLVYDSTLLVREQRQTWKAMRHLDQRQLPLNRPSRP